MVTDGWLAYVLFFIPPSPARVLEKQDFHTMSPTRHGGWTSSVAVNVLFFDGHVEGVANKTLPKLASDYTLANLAAKYPTPKWRLDQR